MLKPPIHWYGGKQKLAPYLLPYIPEHECYVEPYGGAGALLFAKEPSKVEIYNDLHKDVTMLYSVLRDDFESIRERLALTVYGRDELESAWEYLNWLQQMSDDFDPTDRARCFFVIARQSFSARHNIKPGWSASKKTNHALAWMNAIEGLPQIHERLQTVQIECRPALEVITKYDGVDTFQYLDPPYITESRKKEDVYTHEMDDNDHLALIANIKRCKSMILISGYHNELYDDLLGGWRYKGFAANASAINTESSDANRKRTEVIWWNNALEMNRVGAQQYLDLEVM